MRYCLDNFYKSKQWEKLTRTIKAERVNENGDLICGYCGAPITAKYDAICHHMIFLNEENVNDSEISLNPEKIMIVHRACHNKIHHRGSGGGNGENSPFTGRREVLLVYGPPFAGKSTYVREHLTAGDLVVDIDRVWEALSMQDSHVKPGLIKQNVFMVRDLLLQQVRFRQGFWQTAWVIGGYPLIGERERLCDTLGAEPIFIDTPKEECERRLWETDRKIDRHAWQTYIDTWFERYGRGGLSPA